MSKELFDKAESFRREFVSCLNYLEESLPIIIPQTKEDEVKMGVGLNLLSRIQDELNQAQDLTDFDQILDLDELEDSWDETLRSLDNGVSKLAESEATRVASLLSDE